jgi:hypothetical protein
VRAAPAVVLITLLLVLPGHELGFTLCLAILKVMAPVHPTRLAWHLTLLLPAIQLGCFFLLWRGRGSCARAGVLGGQALIAAYHIWRLFRLSNAPFRFAGPEIAMSALALAATVAVMLCVVYSGPDPFARLRAVPPRLGRPWVGAVTLLILHFCFTVGMARFAHWLRWPSPVSLPWAYYLGRYSDSALDSWLYVGVFQLRYLLPLVLVELILGYKGWLKGTLKAAGITVVLNGVLWVYLILAWRGIR